MTVQLDEDPLGSPSDANARALPVTEPAEIEWIACRHYSVIYSRDGYSSFSPPPIKHRRPGHQHRPNRLDADSQIRTGSVRRTLVQGVSALIDRVDARHLRPGVCSRKSEVGVASGLAEYLHFGIHSAELAARGICQRPIAMHKRIHRRTGAVQSRQAMVFIGQPIPELLERLAQADRIIRPFDSVMQVDLHFAQPFGLHLRQLFEQSAVVLFSGIEVRVPEACS